jgi:hypothetical protein
VLSQRQTVLPLMDATIQKFCACLAISLWVSLEKGSPSFFGS